MAAKNILGGASNKPKWFGTEVSGYTEVPVEKKCKTCEYFSNGLCKQKTVLKDKKVKTDKKTGLKVVSPENGCCSFWTPEEEE